MFFSAGRTEAQLKPLTVGEEVPKIVSMNVFNTDLKYIDLEAYRGKLLILDFWTTGCTSCIGSFPKLDSLQREYADNLQIILVTPQMKKDVLAFFKKRKDIKLPNIPIITDDRDLKILFPYTAVPHVIWIDKTGKLVKITQGFEITRDNISAAIKGSYNELQAASSRLYLESPFLPGMDSLVQFSSMIFKPDKNRVVLKKNGNAINETGTVDYLFKIAYEHSASWDGTVFDAWNIVLDSAVSRLAINSMKNGKDSYNWMIDNYYTYNLIIPAYLKSKSKDIMKKDLSLFFGIEATIEKLWVKGYALEKIENYGYQKTVAKNDSPVLFHNRGLNIESLFQNLKVIIKSQLNMPLRIDFINAEEIYDVTIYKNDSLDLIENINIQLKPFNLKIKADERLVPVLKLSKK